MTSLNAAPSDGGRVVVVQIRISSKQAERLEKIYRIFGGDEE
jgi:putative lipoic acid-binding regulatory protein